jgi:hypothetical protein
MRLRTDGNECTHHSPEPDLIVVLVEHSRRWVNGILRLLQHLLQPLLNASGV